MSHFHVRSASGDSVSILNTLPLEPHDALQAYIPLGSDRDERLPVLKPNQCHVCLKIFTTSGHLTRHLKVHTGARDHPCPFPGCGARCSRHDNLQQHYSSHLTPAERSRGHVYVRRALAAMMVSVASEGDPDVGGPPLALSPTESSQSMDDMLLPSLSPSTSHVPNPGAEYDGHSHRPSPRLSSTHSPQAPAIPFTFSHPMSSSLPPATVARPTSTRPARTRATPPPFPLAPAGRIDGFEVSFLRTYHG